MAKIDQVRSYLEKLSASAWPGAVMDEQGNIPIRYGSAVVNISALEGGRNLDYVVFSSMVAKDVPDTPALFGWLNEQNNRYELVKVVKQGGVVEAKIDLIADDINEPRMKSAVGVVGGFADEIDDEVVGKYGGQMPSPPPPVSAEQTPSNVG